MAKVFITIPNFDQEKLELWMKKYQGQIGEADLIGSYNSASGRKAIIEIDQSKANQDFRKDFGLDARKGNLSPKQIYAIKQTVPDASFYSTTKDAAQTAVVFPTSTKNAELIEKISSKTLPKEELILAENSKGGLFVYNTEDFRENAEEQTDCTVLRLERGKYSDKNYNKIIDTIAERVKKMQAESIVLTFLIHSENLGELSLFDGKSVSSGKLLTDLLKKLKQLNIKKDVLFDFQACQSGSDHSKVDLEEKVTELAKQGFRNFAAILGSEQNRSLFTETKADGTDLGLLVSRIINPQETVNLFAPSQTTGGLLKLEIRGPRPNCKEDLSDESLRRFILNQVSALRKFYFSYKKLTATEEAEANAYLEKISEYIRNMDVHDFNQYRQRCCALDFIHFEPQYLKYYLENGIDLEKLKFDKECKRQHPLLTGASADTKENQQKYLGMLSHLVKENMFDFTKINFLLCFFDAIRHIANEENRLFFQQALQIKGIIDKSNEDKVWEEPLTKLAVGLMAHPNWHLKLLYFSNLVDQINLEKDFVIKPNDPFDPEGLFCKNTITFLKELNNYFQAKIKEIPKDHAEEGKSINESIQHLFSGIKSRNIFAKRTVNDSSVCTFVPQFIEDLRAFVKISNQIDDIALAPKVQIDDIALAPKVEKIPAAEAATSADEVALTVTKPAAAAAETVASANPAPDPQKPEAQKTEQDKIAEMGREA